MNRVLCLCLAFWLSGGSMAAQHRYRLGAHPTLNLSRELAPQWKLNLKLESRQLARQGQWGAAAPWQYDYVRTDAALAAAYKTSAGQSLAGGYMLRLTNGQSVHRLSQQYSWVRPFRAVRLAHRLAADQTFAPDEAPLYRFRYRLGLDRALNGESVDPGEAYLKLTHEYLYQLTANQTDLEIRLSPVWGYAFSDANKLELGLDYRLDSILSGKPRSSFWGVVAWYVKSKK